MKNQTIPLGTFFGLNHTAAPSALLATGMLAAGLSAVGVLWLGLALPEAVGGGLAAALLHWLGEEVHQQGHALAARRTGYPMSGVRLWWWFGQSLYPADEPELPARVHVRRALGGVPASLALAALGGVAAWGLRQAGGVGYWLAVFVFLENLLVFALGALLPLGFTDGSTLLRYWGKR